MSKRSRRRHQLLAYRGRHWVYRYYLRGGKPLMTYSMNLYRPDGTGMHYEERWP